MPYKSVAEIDPAVRKALPRHAQQIYKAAFNSAMAQYHDESRSHAVAWAGVKRLYARDEKTGKWHRMKETEPVVDIDAWLDANMPAILADAEAAPDEDTPLTEDMGTGDDEHDHNMCLSMAISGMVHLLSRSEDLGLTDDERTSVQRMIARLTPQVGQPEAMDESAQVSYQESGPRLAQEAYRALVGLVPPLEDDGLPSMLESLKALAPDDADVTPLADATPEQAKELLESLKVWDLRTTEQGQRHAQWEYDLIDSLIEGLKKLRGMTPGEQKAMMAEEQASTPAAQMMAGYRESSEPEGEQPIELRETIEFLQESGDDGREWKVVIIQAGLSKNDRLYSLDVLRRAAPLFEGARCYSFDRVLKGRPIFDHLSDDEFRANPRGYSKDLLGFIKNPMIEGSRLVGTLRLLPSADWLRDNLRDLAKRGDAFPYGLSIDSRGSGHQAESGGREILHVDSIDEVNSVDLVSHPAAGGAFVGQVRIVASVVIAEAEARAHEHEIFSLVESLRQQREQMQFHLVLEDAMDEIELPGSVRRRFRARILSALPQD